MEENNNNPTQPNVVTPTISPTPQVAGVQTPPPEKPKKNIPIVPIIIAVLICIFTIIAVGLLFYSMQNNESTNDQITETVVANPTQNTQSTAEWETFTNEENEYTIMHPREYAGGCDDFIECFIFYHDDPNVNDLDLIAEDENLNYIGIQNFKRDIEISPDIEDENSKYYTDILELKIGESLTENEDGDEITTERVADSPINNVNYPTFIITSPSIEGYDSIKMVQIVNSEDHYILSGFLSENYIDESMFDNIVSTFKINSPGEVQAASNWRTYITRCSLSVNHPEGWNSTKYYINDTSNQCAYITHPEYLRGVDFRKGFYTHITRTKLGTEGGVTEKFSIYTLEDFIKNEESARDPIIPARNVTEKEFGSFSGISYVGIGNDLERSFIFYNDVHIIKISWPIEYEREFSEELDLIIKSLNFT